MFSKTQIETQLEAEITYTLSQMEIYRDTPEEYAKYLERLSELHQLKTAEAQAGLKTHEVLSQDDAPRIKPPSWDTALTVAANVFGILWLARYERKNVIKAPNAFKQVLRPR